MGNEVAHAQGTLNVSFKYSGEIARGDIVEIGLLRTVGPVSSDPAINVPGAVIAIETELTRCTVETPFRARREDRVAGEAIAPGWFVVRDDGLAYQYTPAERASHTGTATGPVTVVADTSDALKVKVDGVSTSVQLTAGADTAFSAIVAEANADLVPKGSRLVVDSDGHIRLEAVQMGKTVELEAVANDCYTLLGLTAAIYYPQNANYDPMAVRGLVIVGGDEGDEIETLER